MAEHWKTFSGAEQVFNNIADQLRHQAYGGPEAMVGESLVRAAVILYFPQAGEESKRNQKRIRDEQRLGFIWMDQFEAGAV